MVDSKKTEKRKCKRKNCGKQFVVYLDIPGRKPSFCPEHRKPQNAARARRAVATHLGEKELNEFDEAITPEEVLAEREAEMARQAMAPEIFAVGLGKYPKDLERAAAYTGLTGYSREELRELARQAKRDYKDVMDASPSAVESARRRAVLRLLHQIEVNLAKIRPSQLANTVKALISADQGTVSAFSDVKLVINLPKESPE